MIIAQEKPYFRNISLAELPYPVRENSRISNDKNISIMYDILYNSPHINPTASVLAGREIRGIACICLMAYDGYMMRWKPLSEYGMREVVKAVIKDERLSEKPEIVASFKKARACYYSHKRRTSPFIQ